MQSRISVVIPTYNRAPWLSEALTSIAQQSLSPEYFEVIVVDNGSTDNTRSVVEQADIKYPGVNFRYFFEGVPGMLSGRHKGAQEANGEIVTFADDDIIAAPQWLEAIVEAFENKEVQMVGGPSIPKYEASPPEWLDWFWNHNEYGTYCGELSLIDFGEEDKEIDPGFVWGLNFSIRRKTLYELGGFHPDCIPKSLQYFQGDGETGLTHKATAKGYKALYAWKARVEHQIPQERLTSDYFCQRYFYQGVCDSYTQVRRDGRLNAARDKTGRLGSTVKRALKRVLGDADDMRFPTNIKGLKKAFQKAYEDGFAYHQKALREHDALLEWVLKEDYWDYELPALTANQK